MIKNLIFAMFVTLVIFGCTYVGFMYGYNLVDTVKTKEKKYVRLCYESDGEITSEIACWASDYYKAQRVKSLSSYKIHKNVLEEIAEHNMEVLND